MVVVAIIGILAGLALPAIDVTRFLVRGGIQSLSSTIQAAQRESVARQHDVIVSIDTVNNAIQVHFDSNNDGARTGGERIRTWPLDSRLVFARGPAAARAFGGAATSFAAGGTGLPSITFHRSGSASEAGGFYVTSRQAVAGLAKRQHDTRAGEVVRATGRVEWFQYTAGSWRRGF